MIVDKKKYFIVLGSGPHQQPVIHAAKQNNYQIILLEHISKKRQEHLTKHWVFYKHLDYEQMLHTLLCYLQTQNIPTKNIKGIATRSYGSIYQIVVSMCLYFRLPIIALPKDLQLFQNKAKLKEKCKQVSSLSIPKQWELTDLLEIESSYFPLIVRPKNGFAKQDIFILSENQILKYKSLSNKYRKEEIILKICPNIKDQLQIDTFFLEEYIQHSTELTVMGLVQERKYIHLCTIEKETNGMQEPKFVELQHIYPPIIQKDILEQIKDIMQNIVSITHLQNTPIVAEFLYCSQKKKIYLVECMPETGGENLAEIILPHILKQNYFKILISLYTKEKKILNEVIIKKTGKKSDKGLAIVYLLPPLLNTNKVSKINKVSKKIEKITLSKRFQKETIFFQELHSMPFDIQKHKENNKGNHTRIFVFAVELENPPKETESIQVKQNYSFRLQKKIQSLQKEIVFVNS